jgi:hypothetical protein
VKDVEVPSNAEWLLKLVLIESGEGRSFGKAAAGDSEDGDARVEDEDEAEAEANAEADGSGIPSRSEGVIGDG